MSTLYTKDSADKWHIQIKIFDKDLIHIHKGMSRILKKKNREKSKRTSLKQ